MKNTFRIILLLYVNIFYGLTSYAQIEYFVKVDPKSGNFIKVKSIPGVHWIQVGPSSLTFDENNQVYFFKGDDSSGKFCLYSINTKNGNVISKPVFPTLTNPRDNLIELQYDNNTKKLYGLHWKDSLKTEFLVSINPANGVFTIVDSIPGVKWIATTTFTVFDEKNHLFIFKGADSKMDWRLYAVDVTTGKVVSKPQFPNLSDPKDNISDIKFNNSTQKIYGLHWDNSEQREYIVAIDRATSTMSLIDSIPGVKWITTMPNYSTIDENKNYFMFRGGDKNMNWFLYTIDLSKGQIINKVLFPKVCNTIDNVIELHFSNNSNQLYALHWEDHSIKRLRDTLICFNSSIRLNVPLGSKWSNGDTGNILRPLKTGYYSYEKFNNCDSVMNRDTLFIKIIDSKPFIGNDTNYCNNFSTILYPRKDYLSYNWSTGKREKVIYVSKQGTYILTTIDSFKCKASDTITITLVNILPIADFVINNDKQCLNGNSFTFTNKSTISQGSMTYNWVLGDGKTSILKDVVDKSYQNEDLFNVRLIVISDKNCSDTINRKVVTWPHPKAEFKVLRDNDCWKNEFLRIVNTSTLKNYSMTYEWDFGNGIKDFNKTPINKKYENKTADHLISLKVFSNNGCVDFSEKKVSILERPISGFSFNDSIQCFKNNSFLFSDKTTFSDLSTMSYLWDFGNGTSFSGKVPQSVIYKTSNQYTIKLITNSSINNCQDTITKVVEVRPQSKAEFTAADVCEMDSVAFINKSQDATSYNWKFGDGNTSKIQNPKHKFQISSTTTYNVTLVALVNNGCADSISKAVTINQNPSSDFSFTYSGNKVDLKIAKAGNSYQWKFGTTDSVKTTATTYTQTIKSSDQTKVCLTATDISGCNSQTCKDIALDISTIYKSSGFKIYPNPTTGKLFITASDNSKHQLTIWNTSGQKVYEQTMKPAGKQMELDLKGELGFMGGIYFIRIQNSVSNQLFKLVVY